MKKKKKMFSTQSQMLQFCYKCGPPFRTNYQILMKSISLLSPHSGSTEDGLVPQAPRRPILQGRQGQEDHFRNSLFKGQLQGQVVLQKGRKDSSSPSQISSVINE